MSDLTSSQDVEASATPKSEVGTPPTKMFRVASQDAESGSPKSEVRRTPTKMYSPVPVTPQQLSKQKEETTSAFSLKAMTKSLEDHFKTSSGEMDTLIKSTLYSVSKKENADAATELEKLRRINRCHNQKSLFLISELNKEITNYDQLRRNCQNEKIAVEGKVKMLEQKVKELQKSIQDLVGYNAEEDSE